MKASITRGLRAHALLIVMFWLCWASAFGLLSSIFSMLGFGGLWPLTSSFLLGFVTAIFFQTKAWRGIAEEDYFFGSDLPSWTEKYWLLLLFLLASLSFYFLFYESRGFFWTRNPNNIGDLPMHIHFIRHFARGGTLAGSHPLLEGAAFKYPSGSALWNSTFEIWNVSTSIHLFLTGVIATLALILLLKMWSGWWGLLAFVWSGGIAVSGIGLGWGPGDDLAWKNLFQAMWVTQRGLLFALPMGLLLLLVHWKSCSKDYVLTQKQEWMLALIWGALPYFHLHSFVMVSLLLGLQCLHFSKLGVCNRFLWFLPLALVPILRAQGEASSTLRWNPGWMAKPNDELLFWLRNFAGWWFVPISVVLLSRKDKLAPMLLVVSLLFSAVMLAPWDWDQTKVFLWLYVFWNFLFFQSVWVKLNPIFRVLAVMLILFPGFRQWTSALPAFEPAQKLWKSAEVEEMLRLTRDLNVTDSVLISPDYFHPILATGQQLWMGYEGHTWAHQLSADSNKKLLEALKNGDGSLLQTQSSIPRWRLHSPYESAFSGNDFKEGALQWKLERLKN